MITELGNALVAGDAEAVVATLDDNVVLRVAVHDEPFRGKQMAAGIFRIVLDGVLRDVEVVESFDGGTVEILIFRARVADHPKPAEGLLVARPGASGIGELTVFLRPLAALQALADEMGRRLGGPRPD